MQFSNNIQTKATPGLGAAAGGSGRSIFWLVDIDAAHIFEAVAEFFDNEHRCECSIEREDVRPEAGRVISEMDEGEELSRTVRTCQREVGKASMTQYCSPEP